MKNIILIAISCLALISCGPSKEEIEARQRAIQDSIDAAQPSIDAEKRAADSIAQVAKNIEYRRQKGYYLASEFGLVPGIVVDWSPQDDDYIQQQLDAGKPLKIYIHIRQDDGAIRVLECDERTWHNIHTNDILK